MAMKPVRVVAAYRVAAHLSPPIKRPEGSMAASTGVVRRPGGVTPPRLRSMVVAPSAERENASAARATTAGRSLIKTPSPRLRLRANRPLWRLLEPSLFS